MERLYEVVLMVLGVVEERQCQEMPRTPFPWRQEWPRMSIRSTSWHRRHGGGLKLNRAEIFLGGTTLAIFQELVSLGGTCRLDIYRVPTSRHGMARHPKQRAQTLGTGEPTGKHVLGMSCVLGVSMRVIQQLGVYKL